MHRLTGWCTCFRESGFQGTHKLGINEVLEKKRYVQCSFRQRIAKSHDALATVIRSQPIVPELCNLRVVERTFLCHRIHYVKSNSTSTRWKFSLDRKVGLCKSVVTVQA